MRALGAGPWPRGSPTPTGSRESGLLQPFSRSARALPRWYPGAGLTPLTRSRPPRWASWTSAQCRGSHAAGSGEGVAWWHRGGSRGKCRPTVIPSRCVACHLCCERLGPSLRSSTHSWPTVPSKPRVPRCFLNEVHGVGSCCLRPGVLCRGSRRSGRLARRNRIPSMSADPVWDRLCG